MSTQHESSLTREENRKRLNGLRLPSQRGVTTVEYALVAALICLSVAMSVGVIGTTIEALYGDSEGKIVAAIRSALARP